MPDNHFSRSRWVIASALLLVSVSAAGCGYHVVGHDSTLPEGWKTIAIPALKNNTTQYRIEQVFTEAIVHEFISRTKYRVVQNEAEADGVLHGEVLSIETTPLLFDATTGEVTTMLVTVRVKVDLVDSKTKAPVYENKDMMFRQQYQISSNVQSFFQEESPALKRMAHDLAAQIVSNVLENF